MPVAGTAYWHTAWAGGHLTVERADPSLRSSCRCSQRQQARLPDDGGDARRQRRRAPRVSPSVRCGPSPVACARPPRDRRLGLGPRVPGARYAFRGRARARPRGGRRVAGVATLLHRWLRSRGHVRAGPGCWDPHPGGQDFSCAADDRRSLSS